MLLVYRTVAIATRSPKWSGIRQCKRRRLRILSGVQSSGRLHLGNYYGAIRQFIQLQNEGEALYFIANLHALTTVRDAHALARAHPRDGARLPRARARPEQAILFRQSDIPEIPELYWILGTVVPMSNLERAHSYKDKIAHGIAADFGLFAYPVLMAADILSTARPGAGGQGPGAARRVRARLGDQFNMTSSPATTRRIRGPRSRATRLDPQAARCARPGDAAVVPGTDGQKMSKSATATRSRCSATRRR